MAEAFRAFDFDPGSARTITAAEALSDPVLKTAGFHDGPRWIRVAQSGEWTVVIEHGQQKVHVDGIDGQLARDADVVFAAANESEPVVVSHLSHGEFVFAFECGAPYDSRAGLRPHLFDDAMDAAGCWNFPNVVRSGKSWSR
ncbi:hypothetical protein [Amycolatopsis sp. CA-230715]|uniref:hypothetical protein n=1 Tax=Amycolatopsis sp. CA-230715 TaxID=2745196 RepID=UPI001C032E17